MSLIPIMENTYILYNETAMLLIDPVVCYEAERQILENFIEEKKFISHLFVKYIAIWTMYLETNL